MTRKDFVAIVGPLAVSRRREMDAGEWRLLHSSLDDIPVHLLRAAVVRASKTRKWFPNECELREDAEACRLELRSALPFEPCAQCSKDGWTEREVDGVRRMVRCQCWAAHQMKLQELGGTGQPLALPASTSISEFTRVGED